MSALQQLLSRKTDQELLFYVNYPGKHTEEAVRLAIAELQRRNVNLPHDIVEKTEKVQFVARNKEKYRLNIWNKFGLFSLLTGIALFFVAGSLFTYRGPTLGRVWIIIGEYSLVCWLPHIIIGIVFMFIRTSKVNR